MLRIGKGGGGEYRLIIIEIGSNLINTEKMETKI